MKPMDEENLRSPKKPDRNTLIGQQKKAYEELMEFMSSGNQMYSLNGYAGVGKSYLTNMFVEDMICEQGSFICVAAPTHKAVFVIRQMAQFKSENLTYSTIHSLLGLRPMITSHGNEKFVKDSQSKNKVGEFDILIIDESSMLDDQLFVYIMEEVDKNPDLKIIFVGDAKQLPPVNHVSSIPMDEEKREMYNIGFTNLTEIIRQKEGNPIIELSQQFRNKIYEPKMNVNEDGEGVIIVPSSSKHRRRVLKMLFTSEEYEKNPNYARATGWTNQSVNMYNKEIRGMIYKDKIQKRIKEFEKQGMDVDTMRPLLKEEFPYWRKGVMKLPDYITGDKLIVDKPIICPDTETIQFQTNEELLMEDYVLENRMAYGQVYKCYIATVKNIFSGRKEVIEICHEDDLDKLEKAKEKLKENALREKKGTNDARQKWIIYYDLEKRFARLKYAPCLTTYKSQGSTYENIVVNVPDILRNPKKRELFQHLYVAVTRASKKVFLFV